MSRTYRSARWTWRSSGGQEARNRCAEDDRELQEFGYRPRRRHASLYWPHYLDVYDERYPSTLGKNYGNIKK